VLLDSSISKANLEGRLGNDIEVVKMESMLIREINAYIAKTIQPKFTHMVLCMEQFNAA
jgi:hypothetical protein